MATTNSGKTAKATKATKARALPAAAETASETAASAELGTPTTEGAADEGGADTETMGAGHTDAAADGAVEAAGDTATAAAPAPPADGEGGVHYRVISPLEHDLKLYTPGAKITLTEAQASNLLGHTVEPWGATVDDA